MNGLDLFSGIGGISIALSEWVKTVCYCETDRYAQGVLLSRMQDGSLDTAPIWTDVRTLNADMLPKIDIIFGGFPCQDISVAGARRGLEGERSRLFFEIVRLVEEIRPTFVFLENVPGIRTRGLDRVCFELARLGYDLRWTIVSAQEVGAPHLRKRWFMLAHSTSKGLEGSNEPRGINSAISQKELPTGYDGCSLSFWNKSFGESVRVDDGLPPWVDRIKCLGNSVVPTQAKEAFERLCGLN